MHSTTRLAIITAGVVSILALFAAIASAQDTGRFPAKGITEISGSVSYLSETPVVNGTTRDAVSTFVVAPSVGYFISDAFELGVDPFEIISQSGGGPTEVLFLVSPAYNFRTQSIVTPYVEGQLGYSSISGGGASATGVSWGLQGGMKLAITGNALLTTSVQYLQITEDPSGAANRFGRNDFLFLAGFAVWVN